MQKIQRLLGLSQSADSMMQHLGEHYSTSGHIWGTRSQQKKIAESLQKRGLAEPCREGRLEMRATEYGKRCYSYEGRLGQNAACAIARALGAPEMKVDPLTPTQRRILKHLIADPSAYYHPFDGWYTNEKDETRQLNKPTRDGLRKLNQGLIIIHMEKRERASWDPKRIVRNERWLVIHESHKSYWTEKGFKITHEKPY